MQKNSTIGKLFVTTLLLIVLLLPVACTDTPEGVVKEYFSLVKAEKFEKINEKLIAPQAREKFMAYISSISEDQEYYGEVIKNYKNIKKFRFLEYQDFPDDELAIKFQIIHKDGSVMDTAWWRLKKIDGKYYIIKFSKN